MGLAKRAFQPHSEEACSSPDPMGTVLCPSPLWLKVYASILWLATGSVAGHSLCLGRHQPDIEASVRKEAPLPWDLEAFRVSHRHPKNSW